MNRVIAALALPLLLGPVGLAAQPECRLLKLMELPVVMAGLQPTVMATINDINVPMLLDSAAPTNMLSQATATQLNLNETNLPDIYIEGVGGSSGVKMVFAKDVVVGGRTFHDVSFLVAESDRSGGAGTLSQSFLRMTDTEFDLKNGKVRLMKPENCEKSSLAYWAGAQEFGVLDIGRTSLIAPYIVAPVKINGYRTKALLDTGTEKSMLSLRAASGAGETPTKAGVTRGGVVVGIGSSAIASWIAPFKEFQLDNETILNTHLRIGGPGRAGDINLIARAEMVLGADFFLSHRIYVAYSQNRVYFTYNGGPVFDLSSDAEPAGPQATLVPDAADAHAAGAGAVTTIALDADALLRRAKAFETGRRFGKAAEDLEGAAQLAPTDPHYAYEAGLERMLNEQTELALADFNQAIKLKPDFVRALKERAILRLRRHDNDGGRADFEAALSYSNDEQLPLQASVAYTEAGQYSWAIESVSTWVATHPNSKLRGAAFSNRCFARAASGAQLDVALSDCDAALALIPGNYIAVARRGIVHLRRGELDRALSDFNASLRQQPRYAIALYGRGLTLLRKGQQAKADADFKTALSSSSHVAEGYRSMGLEPVAVDTQLTPTH